MSDYDYELPEISIAQTPLVDRAAARLLVLNRHTGDIDHRTFRDAPSLLRPGDLLVLNDTRVSAKRLFGRKPTGGAVELLLTQPLGDDRYEALAKPAKRLRVGTELRFDEGLQGTVEGIGDAGMRVVRLHAPGGVAGALSRAGIVPLPPYVHARLDDPERYQTVYARAEGSAAAPTAGLHFTPEILAQIRERGVEIAWVTLDVGFDTFRPVQAEDVGDHVMHGERCTLPPETAGSIDRCKGRIVAVGTTSVRTLESFATGPRRVESGTMDTKLFIHGDYRFKVVDAMFTNFHLPRTSMLMMISSFAGRERVLAGYREALARGYRFLSFGDSMLIA